MIWAWKCRPRACRRSRKDIISTCRQLGKPVVVATQMLESMRFSPAPTRAEVTDVANAVAEGADAVMLSAETASGEYPLEAVQMMSKIIRQVENGPDYQAQLDVSRPKADATVSDAISCAIRHISSILPVAVLVNYSESGSSSLRGAGAPWRRSSTSRPTCPRRDARSVAWGVHSVVNDRLRQVDEVCSTALEIAQAQGMARAAWRYLGDYRRGAVRAAGVHQFAAYRDADLAPVRASFTTEW